ncbi:hypothetical protein [Shewanella sp. Isolate8]|uniref:hypothetical protein n=1 Tax=Shewanella sp. Isolate8 TaxID=2908529 RepID=UPI001EFCA865|nr:hypothetical protein [Shewanella sp. Isolate8]MCG9747915.1 hypothetical protein [Shewanella sp. Isolate8]
MGRQIFLFLFAASLVTGCVATPSQTEVEQQRLGVMVQALQQAIAVPSPEHLEVIARYGTDSRYYVMVRGWLVQTLSGVESQLAASGDAAPEAMRTRAEHLRAAIRRIDLE